MDDHEILNIPTNEGDSIEWAVDYDRGTVEVDGTQYNLADFCKYARYIDTKHDLIMKLQDKPTGKRKS